MAFHTLGCKLNFSETSSIAEQFKNNGYKIVEFKEEAADVYIINTCTVTDTADKECRQIVRRALRENPNAFIAVTGCYAQLRPEEITSIKGVDAVLGSNDKFKIFSLIEKFEKKDISCIYISPNDDMNSFFTASSTDSDNRTRAFFKIQDGCDYTCSFCTIPLARGKSRSMIPDDAAAKFKELLDEGYKEIILTGVNVGDYGKAYSTNLFQLLKKFVALPGDFRIRISSIEPNLLSDDILSLTGDSEKMCKHFHIPMQSGSPKILRLMQRRYNTELYRDLILKAVDKIPEVGIGIDVIVGTPGETENEFLETQNYLMSLPFSYLHVFTYSERPNTKALSIEGNVDIAERKRRNKILRALSEKRRDEFYRRMIGHELEVLFEHENHDGMMRGFSSNYVRVTHPYNFDLVNKFKKIQISDVADNLCVSDIIQSNSLNVLAG
ncbi:MAG: tRNA (N(6)-L-threonylcarbamoyladenosine(37)-C(2))-methylthiotransferase MtaB [bacterium]